MRHLYFLLLSMLIISCGAGNPRLSDSPPSHDLWEELVKAYVSPEGKVDYKGFQNDRELLQQYLDSLGTHHPNPDTWSKEEQLAYWINAYNAFTVELILQHYPLESIKDIPRWNIPFLNTPWKIKFFELGGVKYNLDQIEHDILRKQFEEPRIHFAIVCASVSCPSLRTEAYTAEKLEKQLYDQAVTFINDPKKNVLTEDKLQLSKIFSWFQDDFTQDGTLIDYLNKYYQPPISLFIIPPIKDDAEISYLEYDWGLNE